MNPEMRKALVQRSALALVAFGLIIGIGASASPQPPWPIFLTSFGAFLIFAVVTSLFGDRRLAVRSGRIDAPWIGSNASWTQTFAAIPIESACHLAGQAVTNVGGRRVELINGCEAVGWIGSGWTNIPEWQEYQLDVLVSQDPGGLTRFTCCARPRWKMGWGGTSKSRRLADSLRHEVERLAAD